MRIQGNGPCSIALAWLRTKQYLLRTFFLSGRARPVSPALTRKFRTMTILSDHPDAIERVPVFEDRAGVTLKGVTAVLEHAAAGERPGQRSSQLDAMLLAVPR